MNSLPDEIKVQIFRYVDNPMSLSLADHGWHNISQDPCARAIWMLHKFGRAHALFHAVRFGSKFLTSEVLSALLANKAILSRYFVQRLYMHYGKYDVRLLEFKALYNEGQQELVQAHKQNPIPLWANDLPVEIFTKIMDEANRIFPDFAVRGNDLELFHFLSGGPLAIGLASDKLKENLAEIKDLILEKKFIPFPPKVNLERSVNFTGLYQERDGEYPRKDGYEMTRQLNILARAIILYPDLIIWWKEIGYYEICDHLNHLVMEGSFSVLFPYSSPPDWVCPDADTVVNRIKTFTDRGFKMNKRVMRDALYLFEQRLSEIGDVLFKSFQIMMD